MHLLSSMLKALLIKYILKECLQILNIQGGTYQMDMQKEKKGWMQEAIVSAGILVMCIVILCVSILWIVNPNYDETSKEKLKMFDGRIQCIKEDIDIIYPKEIYRVICMENEKNILITEDQLEYLDIETVDKMEKGEMVSYKIDEEFETEESFEAEELYYKKNMIYSADDFNSKIQSDRKVGWLIAPLMIVGVFIFSNYLKVCIQNMKMQEY